MPLTFEFSKTILLTILLNCASTYNLFNLLLTCLRLVCYISLFCFLAYVCIDL